MVTKILALVIIIGAALTSARTMSSMEKDSIDMHKTFFPPFFAPGLRHGISFGGGKVPGFGGGPGPRVLGGGVGAGFSAAVGSTSGNTFGSIGDAGVGGTVVGDEGDSAGAAGGGQP